MDTEYLERIATGEKVPVQISTYSSADGDFITEFAFGDGPDAQKIISRFSRANAIDDPDFNRKRYDHDNATLFASGFRPWAEKDVGNTPLGKQTTANHKEGGDPKPAVDPDLVERAVVALESIAESLVKLGNPPVATDS